MPTVHCMFLEAFLPSIDKDMWFLLIEISLTALQAQSDVTQKSNFHFLKGHTGQKLYLSSEVINAIHPIGPPFPGLSSTVQYHC